MKTKEQKLLDRIQLKEIVTMADICPVCNKEITSENREVYKSSNYSKETALHDYCLAKFVSKPEGWFEKENNRIEKEEKAKFENDEN